MYREYTARSNEPLSKPKDRLVTTDNQRQRKHSRQTSGKKLSEKRVDMCTWHVYMTCVHDMWHVYMWTCVHMYQSTKDEKRISYPSPCSTASLCRVAPRPGFPPFLGTWPRFQNRVGPRWSEPRRDCCFAGRSTHHCRLSNCRRWRLPVPTRPRPEEPHREVQCTCTYGERNATQHRY
jgi:hypothetical protein